MAPVKRDANQPPFQKDERVLCFHMDLLYEAKILEVERNTPSTSDGQQGGGGWQFKVHYKGWKSTWDDWVPQDRIKKFTEENKELAAQLAAQQRAAQRASKAGAGSKKGAGAAGGGAGGRQNGGSDFGSARGSEERTSTAVAHSGKSRRARDFELEQEEQFQNKPAVRINIPDNLKALLVDDWENVTKNQQLVPLPHPHPVDEIIADYLKEESPKRPADSASLDVLNETMAGLKEYFERGLGRILLYRFERLQYQDIRKMWAKPGNSNPDGKTYHTHCDTYGPEHLCRLLATLPELIAQTNMDQQSVNRLREELSKFTNWLSRNSTKYFATNYEAPSQEYIDKVRNG